MNKPLTPPATGTPGAPTLVKKEVAEFSVTPDVQRIMGMKADPEGYNPEVNQPITDPGARSYAERIQERTAAKTASSLKGKKVPLGHVEPPSREKMEAIAGLGGMPQPNFMEEPPPELAPPPRSADPNPATMRGVGAAYPVNQAMAQGKVDRPVSLREANKMAEQGAFSKETVQALEMANENIKEAAETPAPVPEPKKAAAPSIAKEAREGLDDAENTLPSPLGQMDYATIKDIREGMMSQKRRDEIEKRLKPETLDIGDMIMKRELTQTIAVVPGKLEVTLRTFSQQEWIWILKYIFDFQGSGIYVQELINTCRLVCSLVAVNGSFVPDHRKDIGKAGEAVDKVAFEKKFASIALFPVQLVADMSVQSLWFMDRVDKLFTMEALKNG